MGSPSIPPMPPAPPPAPRVIDPAVLAARRREAMRSKSRTGRDATILTGPKGAPGSPTLGYTTMLGGSPPATGTGGTGA